VGEDDGLDAVAEVEPLADTEQAVAETVAGRVAASVVADLDLEPVGSVADDNIRVAGVGVSERIGQALLDDPVGVQIERAGQRPGFPAARSSARDNVAI
jgi:hypothetical protein